MSRTFLTGTVLLAFSNLLSRLLGVVRTNRFAAVFGAEGQSDAYFAAFQIPDLMYNLVIYGAISAAFIPMLSDYIAKNEEKSAWEFVSNLMNILLLIVLGLGIIVFAFTPQIIGLLYSGFDPQTQQTTVELTRIMLITPLFFCVSGIAGGIQNVYHHFLYYSLAPIIYNLCIIGGIVYLGPTHGIHGAAYGVILGAFLHMAIQIPTILKKGFSWSAICSWRRSDFRETVVLSIPRMFSLGIHQINLIVEAVIASMLIAGSLTMFRYAQDIQYFPIGIIGLTFAISSFGHLSKFAALKEYDKVARLLSDNLHKILFLIIPASVGLYVLKNDVVNAILKFGKFDSDMAETTGIILGILCFNLFALSIIPLLTRAYYAFKNTKTPLIIGICTIVLNIALSLTLSQIYGIYGIAIANVVAYIFQWGSLSIILPLKYPLNELLSASKLLNIIIGTIVMGMIVVYIGSLLALHVWLKLPLLILLGMGVYGVCTWGMEENKLLRKKFGLSS